MADGALTPQEAASHLLMRRRARRSTLAFTQYTFPNYQAGVHHALIAAKLDGVLRGEIKRLIILAPPRHGKSELSTRRFPALYLGTYPDHEVISASYNVDFASDFGRDVRGIVASPSYRLLFPGVALAEDSQRKDRWHIQGRRGGYVSVGIGSATIGRGAHLFLIDDPIKDRKETRAPGNLEDIWDWYRSVVYTRLAKGGAIVLTLTHWHEADPAGRLIEAQATGDKWDVLVLPAINDRGEALWPERYPRETLDQIHAVIGDYEWAALYQQRPAPLEGALFKPDKMQALEVEPADVRWTRAWDFAGTADGGAYTAGVKIGNWNGKPVVADVVRFQGSPDAVERALVATATRDGPRCEVDIPQDPGQAGKAQVQYFTRQLAGFKVFSSPETGDKVTRAAPFAAQVNVGNAYLVRGAWNAPYVEELRVFPHGAYKDQVDASSRGFARIIAKPRSFFG